jgi:septal ring factor EnvC (AmiA/AmiB activator)
MRKLLIPIIAAASALTIGAPASAQWAPPSYRYQSYNYGYGYNGFNFARSMEQRVQRMRGDIREMQARRILSWDEARNLESQAASIQRRIYTASRNGIQPGEARNVENRIQRLEYRISREASDRNGRSGRYGHYY